MRTIHYDMILRASYHIGCNPDVHNIREDGIEAAEAIKWPGMRMIVEDCKDIEKFYASFEYVCVDGARPKFERQMVQVLRGELPEWKLTTVKVDNDELRLSFQNEGLYEKYARKCQDINAWNKAHPRFRRCVPPPFYFESAASYRPSVGAKLRFELDSPIDGSTEVTIVSFRRGDESSVIEFDGNKGRKFTFQWGRHPINQYPVRVMEWMI